MSIAKDERQSTETLSFRCWREWCRLTRGAVVKQRRDDFADNRKCAFTLAEVLITLGVIGVVAALTLPTLIQNYQKKVTATRAKQTYSMINQALKLSEVENGPVDEWTIDTVSSGSAYTGEFFEKFLHPYLKAEFCGDGLENDVTAKCGVAVSGYGKTYKLANGVSLSFVPKDALPNPVDRRYAKQYFVIDVNGPQKPNVLGKDAFYFVYYLSKGLKPYGALSNCTRDEILNGTCRNVDDNLTFGCKAEKVPDGANRIDYTNGCTLLLFMDGWEIKDDYPW